MIDAVTRLYPEEINRTGKRSLLLALPEFFAVEPLLIEEFRELKTITIEPHLLAASNQETGQKMERPEGRIQKVIKIQLFSGFLGSGTINLSFSFLISLSPADSTLGLLLATSAGTRQRV